MFVVKCYNEASGQVETVSDPIADPAEDGFSYDSDRGYRGDWAAQFAREDTNTNHVYYSDDVN